MVAPGDDDLLTRYARDDDHAAFAELVRRYIGLVYAAARRQTRGDAHLADDVTQAVMIVLARRAGSIAAGSVLASWLLVVTRHCARNALKIQSRQRMHEHRAAVLRAGEERARTGPIPNDDDDLSDALHEAIARLREPERSGVVLHYFQNRTHAEVGDALGLSAGAARKRVERAVEKMRLTLSARGVVATGAAVVASIRMEAALAVTVPAHLTSSAFNVAMLASAGQAGSGGGGSLAIAQGVARMFALAKLKTVAAVLVIGAVGVPLAGFGAWALTTVGAPAPVVAAASSNQPASAPADGPFTARVTPEIRVEFLGVAPHPADEMQWHDITGEPIDIPLPQLTDNTINSEAQPDQQIAIRLTHPPGTQFVMQMDNTRTNSNSRTDYPGGGLLRSRFALAAPAETVSLRLGVTTRPWETVAEWEPTDEPAEIDAGRFGPISISPPQDGERWGKAAVSVTHGPVRTVIAQMIAVDDAGKRHEQKLINADTSNDEWVSTFYFDVPHERIKKVILQAREFDKFVVARDIALSPDAKTTPKIEVMDAPTKK